MIRCLGWILALCVLVPQAQAHQPSDAYLTLTLDGPRVEQRLDIALRDLERALALDADGDGRLSWGEVRRRWAEIEALGAGAVSVSAGGAVCVVLRAPGPAQLDRHGDGAYVVLTRSLDCAAAASGIDIRYRLFETTDPTHRGIVQLVSAGGTRSAVLVPGPLPQRVGGGASGWAGFVGEGVHHILIGVDHVLFLLALLLPAVLVREGGRWVAARAWKPVAWDVLRIVTAFTLAHSITLALAVLELVDPPSRWVESIIAASVLLAALNNLRPVIARGRWALTFAFGLVHGFGFAGALKDLGLPPDALAASLLAFNVGVEIGQLAIVALFLPLAWVMRAGRLYRRAFLMAGSAAIALFGLLWLIERALELPLPFLA